MLVAWDFGLGPGKSVADGIHGRLHVRIPFRGMGPDSGSVDRPPSVALRHALPDDSGGARLGGRGCVWGSDAAIEQAEVVLINDRLENFLVARELSVQSRRIIRQNIALSLGTILVMAVVSLTLSRLPLSVGVAVHEGSTVLVVLNSLRLLRVRAVVPA